MNAKLEICKQCDQLGELDRCKLCGCFMQLKTVMPFSTCPIGKWEILEVKDIDNEIRKNN